MRVMQPALITAYPMIKWDPSGEAIVCIKQANQGDDARRAEILMRTEIERPNEGPAIERVRPPIGELIFIECYTTFDSSTLAREAPVDPTHPEGPKKNETIFTKDLGEAEFRRRFDALDPTLVREWQDAVRVQNPNWAPDRGLKN